MAALTWLVLTAVLTSTLGLVAKFKPCNEVSADVCTVTEVRVNPCENAARCVLYKEKDAHMSFDFTPNFTVTNLLSGLYWVNGAQDVEFDAMKEVDACEFTNCPTELGKSQDFNYTLYIGKRIPKGRYTFKLKLWNKEDKSQACCFKTNVQIKKSA